MKLATVEIIPRCKLVLVSNIFILQWAVTIQVHIYFHILFIINVGKLNPVKCILFPLCTKRIPENNHERLCTQEVQEGKPSLRYNQNTKVDAFGSMQGLSSRSIF